jgi:tripartite-type tricarboxylate transporter receptor subunit TctC
VAEPPTEPGGSIPAGRLVATQLALRLGVPVIVENRPGGNNIVGTQQVVRAAPDGYTLLMMTGATMTPAFFKHMPFDMLSDLAPISMAYQGAYVLFAQSSQPYKTLDELIAYAKVHPGKLSVGSSSSTATIGLEIFKRAADIDIVIVSYKGSAAAMSDLLGGHVAVVLDGPTTYMPHVKAGSIQAIATAAQTRTPTLPETPTTAERGWPQLRVTFVGGLWAPAATPASVVERLSREMAGVMQVPEVRAKLLEVGVDPSSSSPQAMRQKIQAEMEHYARGAQLANFEPL